jgi:hypothetical protein
MMAALGNPYYVLRMNPPRISGAGRTVNLGGQRRSLAGYFDLKKSEG